MDEMTDYDPAAIEVDFLASWDAMERYFSQSLEAWGWDGYGIVLRLIKELRDKGYDRTLRAGQAMWTFVVSRSRQHGLRRGQARIIFSVRRDNTVNVRYFKEVENAREFTQPIGAVIITPEIDALLTWLIAEPID